MSGTVLASARGAYQVGELIGDGQYGSVYECVGPFDQPYALKMFRPANRAYELVKHEWQAEMKRLESYRHPHIVYIHDAFEHNHLFYIALERCDTSLRRLVGAPFPDEVLIEYARQLLMAVAYLHDAGLVHSDLHVGNVLVSNLKSQPTVKLSDFGVSHQLDGQHWFRPQVANPKILTPELVTMGYTTRQSDLYQFGLLLFRMHTGYPAFPEDVPYQELSRLIAEGAARQRAEGLGTAVGNVIAKLLRRRDAYRYQSAREVWQDLRVLRQPPASYVPPLPSSRRGWPPG
ncbi:MAG: serine/threonine protein kinase [Myxococcales bacterium]|nr:serine/threonine protein kinase [Myxococcales bacterium]MCC6526682.1 serine/threonine protein kinase [Polyangiaceae bacterium]